MKIFKYKSKQEFIKNRNLLNLISNSKFLLKIKNFRIKKLEESQILTFSFLALIFGGMFLFKLPFSTKNGISWIDALFTSTSAVCVTGLSTIDVGSTFTIFGQTILMILIQFGGLGLMTFVGVLLWSVKQNLSLSSRSTIEYSFLQRTPDFSLRDFLAFIIKFTFVIEGVGFIGFLIYFEEKISFHKIFSAMFHSISAFCNAGFSLYPDSLIRYSDSISVNIITSFLIIMGGIGFFVVFEIFDSIKTTIFRKKKRYYSLFSIHVKIVLISSFLLIIIGTFSLYEKEDISFLEAIFQSITTRTAGFNTVDLSTFSHESLMVMMLLMFIGGSPGSTAGGIKTTTFTVLFLIIFMIKNEFEGISIFKRKIPKGIVYQSLVIFMLYIFASFIGMLTLSAIHENEPLISIMFETVSALGTVGLSVGLTTKLIFSSKVVVIFLMFLGRLGVVTLFYTFIKSKNTQFEYAEEKILIG
ncbi:hypothetical protein JXR93_00495 [bacterium]|nr:hypothetical protein [bacterium]